MRQSLTLAAALGACLVAAGQAGAAPVRTRPVRTVVELFTAQGCAGCPDADKLIGGIDSRKGVVALTLPVDIWDYLGWADTLAEPAFGARQRAYAARFKVREIYTPELVVNGVHEGPAQTEGAVDALVAGGAHDLAGGPTLALRHGGRELEVRPGPRPLGRAEVWLLRVDPREQEVRVKAGDNKGKLVVQSHVVRDLTRLGGYGGGVRRYAVPAPAADGLDTVVLVQGVKGGRIYAAAQD